ncbi:MAG TPA: hypothetical protein VFB45_07740 [Pseudolabrys sp.]|nr:hypothetical protein [Pseudolabrys sp.]
MTATTSAFTSGVKGFVNDALSLCATVDPDFYRILSGVLELDANRPARSDADGIDRSEGLEIALRMLTYAHVEAQSVEPVSRDLPRLELCIRCVSERLEIAKVSGSASRFLSS